jgi:hypothetical protein
MLPTPTIELIENECEAFDRENWLIEEALRLLWAQSDRNFDARDVLLKVAALNTLYNAGIFNKDVETVAKYIVGLANDKHLDHLLDQGSIEAVCLITACPNVKEYLCFASKFCSWHSPEAYPIWDANVRECLWSYQNQNQDRCEAFQNNDLWYYQKFFNIVVAFRNHYKLNSRTFKQLDKFMFRSGDQILKARTITDGMTAAQVEASLGPPNLKCDSEGSTTYTYELTGVEVVFKDDRVTKIIGVPLRR